MLHCRLDKIYCQRVKPQEMGARRPVHGRQMDDASALNSLELSALEAEAWARAEAEARARAEAEAAQAKAEAAQAEAAAARAGAESALRALHAELEAAQAELAAVLASTTWRATRPLRSLAHHLRSLRRAVRAIVQLRWLGLRRVVQKASALRALVSASDVNGPLGLPTDPSVTRGTRPTESGQAIVGSETEGSGPLVSTELSMEAESDPIETEQSTSATDVSVNTLHGLSPEGSRTGKIRVTEPERRIIRPEGAPLSDARLEQPAVSLETADDRADVATRNEERSAQFQTTDQLPVFMVPKRSGRLTLVVKSINAAWPHVEIRTPIVLSVLLAKRLGASLRVVTRADPANPSDFDRILTANNVHWHSEVEFLHSSPNHGYGVPVTESDFFVTTSWRTTQAIRAYINPRRIVHLLQDDERLYYPAGDERLRCSETLSDPDICCVVSSQPLFEHLTTGLDAIAHLREKGLFFEPAFPIEPHEPVCNGKPPSKRMFLFSTPCKGLLYSRGLEAINAALEQGWLNPDDWMFEFAVSDIDSVLMPHGVRPSIHDNVGWRGARGLAPRVDLALCLGSSPFQLDLPLSFAADQAVVIMNGNGFSSSERYSANIFCVQPRLDDLSRAVEAASVLAADYRVRFANFTQNRMPTDWNMALEATVERLAYLLTTSEVK
jgi:hypothetical protein